MGYNTQYSREYRKGDCTEWKPPYESAEAKGRLSRHESESGSQLERKIRDWTGYVGKDFIRTDVDRKIKRLM